MKHFVGIQEYKQLTTVCISAHVRSRCVQSVQLSECDMRLRQHSHNTSGEMSRHHVSWKRKDTRGHDSAVIDPLMLVCVCAEYWSVAHRAPKNSERLDKGGRIPFVGGSRDIDAHFSLHHTRFSTVPINTHRERLLRRKDGRCLQSTSAFDGLGS